MSVLLSVFFYTLFSGTIYAITGSLTAALISQLGMLACKMMGYAEGLNE